jgi:hypothetical protein
MQDLNNGHNNAIAHVTDTSTNCAGFFAGSTASVPEVNPADIQSAVAALENTVYTVASIAAGSGYPAQTLSSTSVIISPTGAFFTTAMANGMVAATMPDSTGAQDIVIFSSLATLEGFIMLHELGHQLNRFGPDASSAVNGANSQAVLDNCFTQDANGVYH